MNLNIVLVEPEIPQNTGNIARTCAALGARLHLIKPLGFKIENRYLKRAGLDYWPLVELLIHDSLESFFAKGYEGQYVYLSTKGTHTYSDFQYKDPCYLFFGRETKGLPEELLVLHLDSCVRIPMRRDARSLNLSNAVAIVAYEASRSAGFPGLEREGKFSHLPCDLS